MVVTIFVGVCAVFFAWLTKFKNAQFGLGVSCGLIFIFLALRYNFGNDYQAYLNGFIEINSYSGLNIFDKTINYEIGWTLLSRLFKSIGFFGMTAAIAALNSFVYYGFIKRNVPINYQWLAVFLYVFSPGLMLTQCSAMRQSLAINIFLLSLPYLQKKRALGFFFCIGLASLFHASALALAPIYLIGIFNGKIRWPIRIALISTFILLFIYGKLLYGRIDQIVSNNFARYQIYVQSGGAEIASGLGVLFLSAILILTIYYDRLQQGERAILFKLNILNLMFVPLGLVILMLGRIGMYFAPASIIVLPIITTAFKNRIMRIALALAIIGFTFYGYFQFVNSPVWKDSFKTYQTILSAQEMY